MGCGASGPSEKEQKQEERKRKEVERKRKYAEEKADEWTEWKGRLFRWGT